MLCRLPFLLFATTLFFAAPAAADPTSILETLSSRIEQPEFDKSAAISLIEATAKIKSPEDAALLVEKLGARYPIEELREKLVASCADIADFDCAYYEAARIEPFNWRMRALSQIASAYAEQGDTVRAKSAFISILHSTARDAPANYRDQLLTGLLASVAEFSFIDIGREAAKTIKNPAKKSDALFTLAISAGANKETDLALEIFLEALAPLNKVQGWNEATGWNEDGFRNARASVAAAAAGRLSVAEKLLEVAPPSEVPDMAFGQIAALMHKLGQVDVAHAWEKRVLAPNRQEWMKGLIAETYMKAGNCKEALIYFRKISSAPWAVATLLHIAEYNNRNLCIDASVLSAEADRLVKEIGSPGSSQLLALLATTMRATSPKPNEMWTGRSSWQCTAQPVIYPGWWDQAVSGQSAPAGLNSTDGSRATAPDVVKLGKGRTTRYYVYYMAESGGKDGRTRILRTEFLPGRLDKPKPKNVALDFLGPFFPKNGKYGADYLKVGPYYGSVLPDLDEDGEPARGADGQLKPWFMYIATYGNNTGVAVSKDGGITFALPEDESVNPIFPFEVFLEPAGGESWRRQPIESESKLYDQNGSGSPTVVRTDDGRYKMFYTALMWRHYTYDDLGAKRSEVFHADGKIPDHGIAYAESSDGLHFTRRTSVALGVTSSAARGTGRLIDPRFRDGAPGELEYTVTKPMIFKDGKDAVTGAERYRMLVSSHSISYRVRSLHSTDLTNWTWDASPPDGLFGLGEPGAFDDKSTTYAACVRDTGKAGDNYLCWYTGNKFGHYSAGKTGIGICTMPVKD